MKKLMSVFAVCLFTGALSLAAQPASESQGVELGDVELSAMQKAAPCAKVNLSDAQKTQIKTSRAQLVQSKKALVAQVKTARQNYSKLLADPKTDYQTAQAASQALATAVSQLVAEKIATKTDFFFQVLTPDQRAAALQCEQLHKKMMMRRCHRHHKKGSGQKQGTGQGSGTGGATQPNQSAPISE